jgi:hypothetical protein
MDVRITEDGMDFEMITIRRTGANSYRGGVVYTDDDGNTHRKKFRDVTQAQAKSRLADAFKTTMDVTVKETVAP